MKKFIKEFILRGLMCAAGGPLVLAIIYGILGTTGEVASLTPHDVSMGILSITLLAFIAAGITAVYQMEQLPLLSAILLHGGVLYLDYLLMYLLNEWIPRDFTGIGIFTAIFVVGYAVIWLGIYFFTNANTKKINSKLQA